MTAVQLCVILVWSVWPRKGAPLTFLPTPSAWSFFPVFSQERGLSFLMSVYWEKVEMPLPSCIHIVAVQTNWESSAWQCAALCLNQFWSHWTLTTMLVIAEKCISNTLCNQSLEWAEIFLQSKLIFNQISRLQTAFYSGRCKNAFNV